MYSINPSLSKIIISRYEDITGNTYIPCEDLRLSFNNVKEIFRLFDEINMAVRLDPGLPDSNTFAELSDLVEVIELDYVSNSTDDIIIARFPGVELEF